MAAGSRALSGIEQIADIEHEQKAMLAIDRKCGTGKKSKSVHCQLLLRQVTGLVSELG